MAKGHGGGTLRQVHLLFNVGTIGGLTDGQLLEQFRSQGGEAGELASGKAAWAVVPTVLVDSTIRAAMAYAAGKATTATVISSSVAALTKGILKMMFLHKLKMIAGALLTIGVIATSVGVWAQQASRGTRRTAGGAQRSESRPQARRTTSKAVESSAADEGMPAVLKYGDERADGKQSFGGSGEMIEFSSPSESAKVAGLRIHGSRYGLPQPPEENFLIYFLSHDLKRILHTEMAPYSLFERGPERWVEVTFERTIDLPKTFWVALDFRANQRKGVYVSFDASTGGKHSRVGLPGIPATEPRFGGDWMIEAILAKRNTVQGSS